MVTFTPQFPNREVDLRDIQSVIMKDNIIELIVRIPGDHPVLITLDLDKFTFTTEGYD